MGPTIGQRFHLDEQVLKNAVDISSDFFIRESNVRVATVLVQPISRRIALCIMCLYVDFDDQCLLRAKEIRDVVADDVLAAELVTTKLRSAEIFPKLGFERTAVLPQRLRSTE